jgi:hypothetical protein
MKKIMAKQGVRQNAETIGKPNVLKAGEVFVVKKMLLDQDGSLEFLHNVSVCVPEGCIAIKHPEKRHEQGSFSVIRDDCKAARKAIRSFEKETP